MRRWLRRLRGALAMGLIWAAGWGVVGVLIAIFVDPDGSIDDMWVATLGIPGFLSGAVFSAVLGIAEHRRRFEELSLPRVAAWGALTGLLLGALPFAAGEPTDALPLWLLGVVIIGPMTLLSAAPAAGSPALARRSKGRNPALMG